MKTLEDDQKKWFTAQMSPARIVIYGSTVAGSIKVKAEQARITHILEGTHSQL